MQGLLRVGNLQSGFLVRKSRYIKKLRCINMYTFRFHQDAENRISPLGKNGKNSKPARSISNTLH